MNTETVIKMYNDDEMSVHQIAKKFNTYPNKIRRLLKHCGVTLRTRSETQKLALENGSATHPTEGRSRSYEERLKISQKMVSYWGDMDDDQRQVRADQAKENWNALTSEKKHEMRELATAALKAASKGGSKFENFVKRQISDAGYDVEAHKKDLIFNEKLEIDLYIKELRTIIEVDGPSHFYPVWGEAKLQKQIRADHDKNGLILTQGFVVIRVQAMKDSLSIAEQDTLVQSLLSVLENIKTKFPDRPNRYIEVSL